MSKQDSTSHTCYPTFSWDKVPIYQMFADEVLFTDEQVEIIAPTTNFICIEKQHGIHEVGAADVGARHAIGQFKAAKPGMKCLAYLNSAFAYTFISPLKMFDWRGEIHKPENSVYKGYLITDPDTGELAFRENDHVFFFDVLNPDLRDWWVETAATLVQETGADGLFVDQMHGFGWLRKAQAAEVASAQAEMMRKTKNALGEKLLLLNNAAAVPELFEIGDAFMFEHYLPELLSKQQFVEEWALMMSISTAGKIAVWRIGVEHDDLYTATALPEGKSANAVLEEVSRKRIEYYLAAFLIGAQENSYFQYGWGWDIRTGPLCAYPEWTRPLGKPQDDARRDTPECWIFRRNFEYASVMVDLDKREGSIEWRS